MMPHMKITIVMFEIMSNAKKTPENLNYGNSLVFFLYHYFSVQLF